MKKIVLLALLLPAAAMAQEAAPAPTSPMPIMSSMVGQLAGELASTQARLQDANGRIQQLEQALKAAAPKPAEPASK